MTLLQLKDLDGEVEALNLGANIFGPFFVRDFCLGGGNSNMLGMFTPIFGEMIQFDEHIFHMVWVEIVCECLFVRYW